MAMLLYLPLAPVVLVITAEEDGWIFWHHPPTNRYGKLLAVEYEYWEDECQMLKYPSDHYQLLLARTPRRRVHLGVNKKGYRP